MVEAYIKSRLVNTPSAYRKIVTSFDAHGGADKDERRIRECRLKEYQTRLDYLAWAKSGWG